MESPELMNKGGETGPGSSRAKARRASRAGGRAPGPGPGHAAAEQQIGRGEPHGCRDRLAKAWIDQGAKHSVQQARQVVWQPLPPGVNPIYTVAMTKDGRFAACGRANQIFLYDLATRQFVARLSDPRGRRGASRAGAIAGFQPGRHAARERQFSRGEDLAAGKGEPVASAAKSAAPASEALLKQVADGGQGGRAQSRAVADGKHLVTGCDDGSVRVWDVATAKPIIELRGSVAASQQMAALEWTIAAQGLEQSFQKAEATRIEAQNKALDVLLEKANETIIAMKKALPEKEKAVKPAQEAKTAAQKALDDVAELIAKAPDGKPDAALEKQQKDAHEQTRQRHDGGNFRPGRVCRRRKQYQGRRGRRAAHHRDESEERPRPRRRQRGR